MFLDVYIPAEQERERERSRQFFHFVFSLSSSTRVSTRDTRKKNDGYDWEKIGVLKHRGRRALNRPVNATAGCIGNSNMVDLQSVCLQPD